MTIKLYFKYLFYNLVFVFIAVPVFIISISLMYLVPASQVVKLTNWHTRFFFKLLNIKATYHFKKVENIKGALVVANHISWMDIMVMSEAYNIMFIAKTELRTWPILGKVIEKYGSIFVRKSRQELKTVNTKIISKIKKNHSVAVFPEGFTTDGDTVLPFRSAIFQVAIDTKCPVVPIVITYLDKNKNNIAPKITYNNKNLWQSAKDTVKLSPIDIHIFQLPMIDPGQFKDRNDLCEYVQLKIQEQYLKVINHE